MNISGPVRFVPPRIDPVKQEIELNQKEYDFFKKLLFKKSGISLRENKASMVQSRLCKRLKVLGLSSYREYVQYLESDGTGKEYTHFINALTTNKTEFFREPDHFEFLKKEYLLPFAESAVKKPIFVWSAASSTGEEIYTLAMVLEAFKEEHRDFSYRILGSDIDTNMLRSAHAGIFPERSVKELPYPCIQKYFLRGKEKNRGFYKISPTLKRNIKFRHHNLTEYQNHFPIQFDIIFLRNLLIYFNKKTVEKVIHKISNHLLPGGMLFIGHSETLHNIDHKLESIGLAVFRKTP